jgi:nucleoside-diphosphate-sugar epimerase
VYTSSCGVWANSVLHPLTETDPRTNAYDNDYDLSKCLAEKSVREYCHKGLFTVIVNPPRVYGPGISRHSNAVNRFLSYLINSRIAFVPSAYDVQANYAFIDDVVNGHLLAMDKGLGGERYILGGENASYRRLLQLVKASTHVKNIFLPLPNVLATLFSWVEIMRAKICAHEPVLVPGVLRRFATSKTFDCNKAIRQLGYTITPLEKGIAITVDYLKNSYGKS